MEKITLEEFLKIKKSALKGKLFCFPTDTVYGVAAIASDKKACKKIYEMKNRSLKKPLPLLCGGISDVVKATEFISDEAMELLEKNWPGALTIILNKKPKIYKHISDKTLAFRMPDSEIALAIIEKFSLLATTSVNISGEKEMNNVDEICDKFKDYIDYIIIDKVKLSNVASTVVDASSEELKVLRQGKIII